MTSIGQNTLPYTDGCNYKDMDKIAFHGKGYKVRSEGVPCSRSILIATVEHQERVWLSEEVLLIQLVGTQLHSGYVLKRASVARERERRLWRGSGPKWILPASSGEKEVGEWEENNVMAQNFEGASNRNAAHNSLWFLRTISSGMYQL